MSKKEGKLSYYLAGIAWVIFFIFFIGLAGYYAGNAFREYRAADKLKAMLGFLPGKDALNHKKYSRKLDFYTVSQNTPDFSYEAFDADFKKAALSSDANGFITGGPELSLRKKPGTIRIFITGGSAAFGTIQGHNEVDDTYPAGTYCYDVSIAGYLKKMLEDKFPDKKFEVINAAVVQHLFNQNYAMYFEKIHDFDPDIIISMDGWNDAGLFLFSKHNGNPYQMTDQQSEEGLELELLSRYCSSYSSILETIEARAKSKMAAKDKTENADIPFTDLNERDYKKVEPIFIRNAQKLLWICRSYVQQLKHDSIYAIVSLQPMLDRREMNKKLSPLELKFRHIIEGNEFRAAAGSFNSLIEPEDRAYFEGMDNDRYNAANFMDAFFFDKYLTGKLDTLVVSEGGTYIDIGKEIENMGADKEFFVDYCHMTPYGNHFIANVFARSVSDYLLKRGSYMNSPVR